MFDNYIISKDMSILDALMVINSMDGKDALTLFVTDSKGSVIGTLTDGDIRRSLVNGHSLESEVSEISYKNFTYLKHSEYDIQKIHDAKSKGIELIPVLDDNMVIVDLINLKKQKSYLPIDAVLMAGGKGERLRPLTDNTPKPLLKMEGKAIIDYILEHIIDYGIKNISVTVNYLKEQIEEHFAVPFMGVDVKTVREPNFLGTIGSLSFVKSFHNDTVLLMNSDALTNINLEDFYLDFFEKKADMSVAALPYTVSVPYGILDSDGQRVKGITEKPTYNYYANTGIYLIKKDMIELIPKGEFLNATDFMNILIDRGFNVTYYPFNGTWFDIGNHQEFQKTMEIIKHL